LNLAFDLALEILQQSRQAPPLAQLIVRYASIAYRSGGGGFKVNENIPDLKDVKEV
jgi:hypothetical protein